MEYDFVSFDYSKNLNIIFVQTIIICNTRSQHYIALIAVNIHHLRV